MPLLPPIGQESATAQVQWVSVKNTSGAEIPGFGLMDATGVTTVDGKPVVQVRKPAATFRRFWYVNGPVPIPAGKTGSATILMPQVWALYETGDGTPAIGESWGVANNSHKLRKNRPGFNVMGGAANGRVLITQHVVNSFLGKTDASHSKGAAGNISVYFGAVGSEADPGDFTVSAYNKYATLASGKWVTVEWLNSAWYLGAGEC